MQDKPYRAFPGRERILIADDADVGRGILRSLLKKDYDVIEAKNGLEVIQILKSAPENIATLLLDMMMPVMDGFGVLEFMRRNGLTETIPTIAITAISDPEGKIACYEAGAADFIEKPYDPKLLLYKIKRGISVSRAAAQRRIGENGIGSFHDQALDALPVAIFYADAKSRIATYSNALFETLPFALNGRRNATIEEIFPAGVLPDVQKAVSRLVSERVSAPVHLDLEKSGRHLTLHFTALQDAAGDISDIVGTIVDNTRDFKCRRDLERRIEELSRGRFAQ